MSDPGRKTWAIAGGRIPFGSTGDEPEFTSRDELSILNAGQGDAQVKLTIFYADRDPAGPYSICVAAQRVRVIRFNDLIDPRPLPLGVPYAALIESDRNIVVQFMRQDTRQAENALFALMAFPLD
jgi:hypothetical protein